MVKGTSNAGGGGKLTKDLTLEERINMAEQLGLPEYPRTEDKMLINEELGNNELPRYINMQFVANCDRPIETMETVTFDGEFQKAMYTESRDAVKAFDKDGVPGVGNFGVCSNKCYVQRTRKVRSNSPELTECNIFILSVYNYITNVPTTEYGYGYSKKYSNNYAKYLDTYFYTDEDIDNYLGFNIYGEGHVLYHGDDGTASHTGNAVVKPINLKAHTWYRHRVWGEFTSGVYPNKNAPTTVLYSGNWESTVPFVLDTFDNNTFMPLILSSRFAANRDGNPYIVVEHIGELTKEALVAMLDDKNYSQTFSRYFAEEGADYTFKTLDADYENPQDMIKNMPDYQLEMNISVIAMPTSSSLMHQGISFGTTTDGLPQIVFTQVWGTDGGGSETRNYYKFFSPNNPLGKTNCWLVQINGGAFTECEEAPVFYHRPAGFNDGLIQVNSVSYGSKFPTLFTNSLKKRIYKKLKEKFSEVEEEIKNIKEAATDNTERINTVEEDVQNIQNEIEEMLEGGLGGDLINQNYSSKLIPGETYTLRDDINIDEIEKTEENDILSCGDFWLGVRDGKVNFYNGEEDIDYYLYEGKWYSESNLINIIDNPTLVWQEGEENYVTDVTIFKEKVKLTLKEKFKEIEERPIKGAIYEIKEPEGPVGFKENIDIDSIPSGKLYMDEENGVFFESGIEGEVPGALMGQIAEDGMYVIFSQTGIDAFGPQLGVTDTNVWFKMGSSGLERTEAPILPNFDLKNVVNDVFLEIYNAPVDGKQTLKQKLDTIIHKATITKDASNITSIVGGLASGNQVTYYYNFSEDDFNKIKDNTHNVQLGYNLNDTIILSVFNSFNFSQNEVEGEFLVSSTHIELLGTEVTETLQINKTTSGTYIAKLIIEKVSAGGEKSYQHNIAIKYYQTQSGGGLEFEVFFDFIDNNSAKYTSVPDIAEKLHNLGFIYTSFAAYNSELPVLKATGFFYYNVSTVANKIIIGLTSYLYSSNYSIQLICKKDIYGSDYSVDQLTHYNKIIDTVVPL